MKYIPFTQTPIWAQINQVHNNLEAQVIDHENVSCLFGIDKILKSMTAYNGPVIDNDESAGFAEFLRKVVNFASEQKLHNINFRNLPPLRASDHVIEQEFVKAGFKKHTWQTIIVDLNLSPEELLKKFAHAARKNIRKAEDAGVQIIKCTEFEQFYTQYLLPYMAMQNRLAIDKAIYKQCWDLDRENIYHYWVAKHGNGEILGFLGSYRYAGVATEIMSALTPLAFTSKIPAQDLLHYELIKYHKMRGDAYFDLAGFNPNPTNNKEVNIRKFKEKWGGEVYDVSSYTMDTRNLMQKVINKMLSFING